MGDIGHWICNDDFDVNEYEGFIYLITFPCGKFYVGRRTFWNKIIKTPLKTKKRKRVSYIESEWRTYESSSVHVKSLIEQHRESQTHSRIKFEIIQLCRSKSAMSYGECFWIITTGSMTDPLGMNFNIGRVPCKPKE